MTHDIWLIATVQWRLARAPAETAGLALCLRHPEDQLKASGLQVFGSLRDQFIFMLFTPQCFILFIGAANITMPLLEICDTKPVRQTQGKGGYLHDSDSGSLSVPVLFLRTHSYRELAEPRPSFGCCKLSRRISLLQW